VQFCDWMVMAGRGGTATRAAGLAKTDMTAESASYVIPAVSLPGSVLQTITGRAGDGHSKQYWPEQVVLY